MLKWNLFGLQNKIGVSIYNIKITEYSYDLNTEIIYFNIFVYLLRLISEMSGTI